MNQAWSAFQAGRVDDAERMLGEVVGRAPNQPTVWVAMGMVQAAKGLHDSALKSMERAVRIDPRCVPALNWIATLSLEKGDAEAAFGAAAQASKVSPNDPEVAGLLGRSSLALGRANEAIGHFDRAIAGRGKDPVLRFGRAEALESLARDSEAAAEYRAALALGPDLEGYSRLAELELIVGRLDASIEASRAALALDGTCVKAQVLLARALAEQGQSDEAEDLWRKAERNRDQLGWVLHQKARALSTLGDFPGAIVELERAIEADPTQVAVYLSLVGAKKLTEQDRPLIASMERLLGEPSLKPEDLALLHFALGKAHDRLSDWEQAIHHFDLANEIEYQRSAACRDFSDERVRTQTNAQIRAFERLKGRSETVGSDLPIFVIGMMRSGTTLLEQILSCHSRVAGAGELPFWLDHASVLMDSQASHEGATAYVSMLSKDFPGCARVVDKNPANYLVAGLLHSSMPNARIIHTVRDPIATVLSIWMTPMRTPAPFVHSRRNIVSAYREYVRLMSYWRQALPADRFMEVSYERLVAEPGKSIPPLIGFCGLEWQEACLHPEAKKGSIKTPSFWQARQPLYTGSVEKWRAYERWLGEFIELAELAV